jgi:capsular polysaccharide biosynthesis protein
VQAVYESSYNGSRSVTSTNGVRSPAAFAGASEVERPFTLSDLARVLRMRLWVILLVVAVVVGVAVMASLWQTPKYEASAMLLVGQEQGNGQDTNLGGAVSGLQALTQTMIIAIDTPLVADEAIRRLGLKMSSDQLLQDLTIQQVESSQFIQLTYTGTDPERAAQIVNTVGQVSSERIAAASATANNITATVYQKAEVPDHPSSPDPLRNGLLAGVLGLMLGIGLALLMEYLDYSWRSPEEVEQISGVPTFAIIPEFGLAMKKRGHKHGRSRKQNRGPSGARAQTA